MRVLLEDPSVDSLLVIFIPPIAGDVGATAQAIRRGADAAANKPILSIFMSAQGAPDVLQPIPSYAFPESAATALARAATYAQWRRRTPEAPFQPVGVEVERARRLVAEAMARGGGWLPPQDAESLLAAFGISTARSRAAETVDDAVAAAQEIGFPVALKAVGPTILHKTEVGGVVLRLGNARAVARSFREMRRRLGPAMTGALVQEMVSGGVEVIVGGTYDPSFGPLVLYGTGGTMVDLYSDVAFRMPPLTERDAADMMPRLEARRFSAAFAEPLRRTRPRCATSCCASRPCSRRARRSWRWT
jgi:acyl-CoA synthetase (NDP forming)